MHRAFSFSVKVTTIVLLVLGAAGFAFAEPVVTLFRRSDPEVIRIGTETFRIQILTVWAWGFITLSNMYTQAIGYGIRSTILAAARQGLFLIPTLLVLPNVWGAARAGSLPAAGGCADACPRRLDDDEGHSYAEGANGAGNRVKPLQIA